MLGLRLALPFLIYRASAPVVAITSIASLLYVGVEATVSGTTNAGDGTAVSLTVNGETFASGTVSGGAWSVTGTPTEAMVGTSVTAEVTIPGATDSTSVEVWSFSELTTNVLWLEGDFSDVAGTYTWADRSPSSNDCTQATAAQQPAISSINSIVCPDFDGTDDNLDGAAVVGASTAAHFWGCVFKADGWDTRNTIRDHGSTRAFACERTGSGFRIYVGTGGLTDFGAFAFSDLVDAHTLLVAYDGTGATNAERLRAWLDGVEQTLTFTGTIPAAVGVDTSLTIGSNVFNASAWNGKIGGMVDCQALPSDTERGRIHERWQAIFGTAE